MGQSRGLQNNMSTVSHFGTLCPVNGAHLEDWPRGLSCKPPTQYPQVAGQHSRCTGESYRPRCPRHAPSGANAICLPWVLSDKAAQR